MLCSMGRSADAAGVALLDCRGGNSYSASPASMHPGSSTRGEVHGVAGAGDARRLAPRGSGAPGVGGDEDLGQRRRGWVGDGVRGPSPPSGRLRAAASSRGEPWRPQETRLSGSHFAGAYSGFPATSLRRLKDGEPRLLAGRCLRRSAASASPLRLSAPA